MTTGLTTVVWAGQPRRNAMTTTRRLLVFVVGASVVAGCAGPTAPVTPAPTPTGSAQEALDAYERFWEVTQDAYAAPGTRDWAPEVSTVASGAAFDSLMRDIRNYAEFPAHLEGVVSRAPVVSDATDTSVMIVDCVDLGDSRLVADRTGEVLNDLANRVQRYSYRADVVRSGDRWLVERTEAALEEPC
jgi:PBP1b-binding outer membrane lipoprotein LpoB